MTNPEPNKTGMVKAIAPKMAFFLPNLSPKAPPIIEPNKSPRIKTVPSKLLKCSLSQTKSNFVDNVSSKYELS